MAIDVVTFRTRFPEFADAVVYPDARITLFISDSVLYIGDDENHWRGKYDLAQAYLTAHLLALATGTEAGDSSAKAGPIQSKSAGGVSVTRAAMAKSMSTEDDLLSTTSYGMQYLVIRDGCFTTVLAAVCV